MRPPQPGADMMPEKNNKEIAAVIAGRLDKTFKG
jgi:hypothetical protein